MVEVQDYYLFIRFFVVVKESCYGNGFINYDFLFWKYDVGGYWFNDDKG